MTDVFAADTTDMLTLVCSETLPQETYALLARGNAHKSRGMRRLACNPDLRESGHSENEDIRSAGLSRPFDMSASSSSP